MYPMNLVNRICSFKKIHKINKNLKTHSSNTNKFNILPDIIFNNSWTDIYQNNSINYSYKKNRKHKKFNKTQSNHQNHNTIHIHKKNHSHKNLKTNPQNIIKKTIDSKKHISYTHIIDYGTHGKDYHDEYTYRMMEIKYQSIIINFIKRRSKISTNSTKSKNQTECECKQVDSITFDKQTDIKKLWKQAEIEDKQLMNYHVHVQAKYTNPQNKLNSS